MEVVCDCYPRILEAIIKYGQTGWPNDRGLYCAVFLSKLDFMGIFEDMCFNSTVRNTPRVAVLRWKIGATETF